MHGEQRGGGAEFDGEIAVAHAVHAVLREQRAALGIDEAEQFRDELAVDGQRAAGDRTAAEGQTFRRSKQPPRRLWSRSSIST